MAHAISHSGHHDILSGFELFPPETKEARRVLAIEGPGRSAAEVHALGGHAECAVCSYGDKPDFNIDI